MKKVTNTKGWKIKCFQCSHRIKQDEEYYRSKYRILCSECGGLALADQAAAEVEQFEEEEWARNHPGVNREQYEIDQANLRKYGEY